MIAIAIVTGVLGVVADAALEPGRPARDARPPRRRLPPPAAALARLLHAHAHRRGAVADPNDIGGVQNVVTNTATSIASNVTTVAATMVGMLVLNWKLALFALALIPLFAC